MECSAIIRIPREELIDKLECRNGFPVFGSCLGTAGTPMCCRVEACGLVYNANGGRPIPPHVLPPDAGAK